MIPTIKRKSSTHALSPPPSKKSPLHAFSPPHGSPPPLQPYTGRPLTTAAAAVAAIKRSSSSSNVGTPYKRQNTSNASRQGSVETEREGSAVQEENKTDEVKDGNKEKDAEADAEDDEKEDVIVDMDAHMQAQMEKAKEDMKILLENFSEDQLQRYEGYRRSALNRTNVKRVSIIKIEESIWLILSFLLKKVGKSDIESTMFANNGICSSRFLKSVCGRNC